jgi:hypothetical protein
VTDRSTRAPHRPLVEIVAESRYHSRPPTTPSPVAAGLHGIREASREPKHDDPSDLASRPTSGCPDLVVVLPGTKWTVVGIHDVPAPFLVAPADEVPANY